MSVIPAGCRAMQDIVSVATEMFAVFAAVKVSIDLASCSMSKIDMWKGS